MSNMNMYVYSFPCIWEKITDCNEWFWENTVYLQLTTTGMCYLTIKTCRACSCRTACFNYQRNRNSLTKFGFINIFSPPRHMNN